MSNFQSISSGYRISDSGASGFPIIGIPTLDCMRETARTEFGQRLRSARLKAGLTQKELAKKAGFESQGSIAELEKIGQGSSNTPQLAAALGVTPEWLASGDASAAPAWPLAGILSPAEWATLPDGVKKQIRDSAAYFVDRYRESGKLSVSQVPEDQRAA